MPTQRQGVGGEVGTVHLGQKEEPGGVGQEAEAAVLLGGRPTDPAAVGTQMFGGGTKDQQRQPAVGSVGEDLSQAFADGLKRAQVMMLGQQRVEAVSFMGLEPACPGWFHPLLLGGVGQRKC